MSRSRRKQPISAITTAKSERSDKKLWHKKLRSKEKQRLKSDDLDNYTPLTANEVSNPWTFAKDGKLFWKVSDCLPVALLKKMMRK